MPASTLPFTLRQAVFIVGKEFNEVTCPSCGGERNLIGRDGEPVQCSRCRGQGEYMVEGPWAISKPQTVIGMTIYDEAGEDDLLIECHPDIIMGVPADQVFEEFEDALADAKRRNAEEEAEG